MHGRTAGLIRNAACLVALWCAGNSLRAQNGATFEVHTAGDQATFHIGERIPLELRFTAPAEAKLLLNNANYDRSGRMMHEEFAVSPGDGWADPLRPYFGSSSAMMMGGISGIENLSPKPTSISIDLNEWVRFDRPGDYRVTISSHRVTDPSKRGRPFGVERKITAAPLLLHIVPANDAWQAEKLKSIRAVLNATAANANDNADARRQMMADLRYLQSKAAIEELAANLRDDQPETMSDSGFGLMGLPRSMHDTAVAALQSRIDDPQFPVSGWLLETVAVLNVHGSDSRDTDVAERNRAREDVWRRASSALSRKQGSARAATAQTLLSQVPADLDAEAKRQLGSAMAASLSDLPEEKRESELQGDWDAVRSPSILPVLKASAKLPLDDPGSNRMDLYTRRGLKTIALARWYEFDPAGATQEALAQIGSAHPSLTAESLYFLPEQQLPQFEAMWAQAFAATPDYEQETVLGALLVRFGTGSATGTVQGKLQQKICNWACAPQAAALAYMLKFSPEEAGPLLQRAADAHSATTTQCNSSLFQEVSRFANGPVLNDVAVEALDSPNAREVMDALLYLTAFGRKEDRSPIWKHFLSWHERWQGKEEVLDANSLEDAEAAYLARSVGENLGRALIANQGWRADATLLQQVLGMCVGEQMCHTLKQVAEQAQSHDVNFYRDGSRQSYHVEQYEARSVDLLRQKLSQYPKGTSFRLPWSDSQTSDQKAMDAEVRKVFEEEGMTLVPATPPIPHRFATE